MLRALFSGLALTVALAAGVVDAQAPRLDDVVKRVGEYVVGYEAQLAAVVAEETYVQTLEPERSARSSRPGSNRDRESYGPRDPGVPTSQRPRQRTLRSDYALVRVEPGPWIGYRDTFEVDGRPVRDREDRLQRLLATGGVAQAARIAEENARFNLAGDLLTRNINVPTLTLELLHPRRRDRFSVRRSGTEEVEGRTAWVLEFRERDKPTIVRQPDGGDQASRLLAVVDPLTGTVMRTTLAWERVTGSIVVTYGSVPTIPVPVPLSMTERYTTRDGFTIGGDALYAKYRRFQTSGRLITPSAGARPAPTSP